jgi:excisionase family DNA binding protein
MAGNLTPVFIRLPKQQAAALDRLADASGRSKQHVVSELVGQALTLPKPGPLAMGRVEMSSATDTRADEVLTLEEVALVLKLPSTAVRQRAEEGDIPGRRFASEWRFSRLAVLSWLADGDKPRARRRS